MTDNSLPDVPINLLESLINQAKGDGSEEFKLDIGRGRFITAKVIRDADSINKIYRKANQLTTKTRQNTPASWHPYLPISSEVAQGIAFAEAMMVEPKWTHLEMLRLAKEAGGFFLEITTRLKNRAFLADVESAADEIDSEGND